MTYIYIYNSNFSKEDNFLFICMVLYIWNLICRCKHFINSWLFEISFDTPQQCTWNKGCDYNSSVSELPNIFHCKLNIRKEIDQMHFSQRFWIEFDIMILVNYHLLNLKFRLKLFYNYTCTVEFWFWANFCESSMQLWIGWFECLSSVDDVWNYVSLMPCCLWWLKVSILNACLVIWIKNFYLWKE